MLKLPRLRPLVFDVWRHPLGEETVRRWRRFILWHVRQLRERTTDLVYDVDTFGPAPNDIHDGVWPYAYDSASWSAPLKILKRLSLDFSRFTFVDMGSGKGRVVLSASTLPFMSVIGVEFSPPLCRIAERNLVTCRYLPRRATNIRSVEGDATAFPVPDTPCIYYFYNPFSLEIMKSVIEKSKNSYFLCPRDIILICVGMSTVFSNIAHIDHLKLQHSFDLQTSLFNRRSVFIFSVEETE
jgi:SAM-dependent methyltransferase